MLLAQSLSAGSTFFLVLALGLALGFEFVNGFHDTANAVATVIYTHTLKPWVAVIWSGIFNLSGVFFGGGLVAFTIVSLLPVELVLNSGSGAGFAMVFALLISAITWNLGTWYLGLPASSSHTLIGSIIGVGLANALINNRALGSGVNWGEVTKVFKSLLMSPLFGFVFAGLLLLSARKFIKAPALFKAPPKDAPPPLWIRIILVFTCTGVSFFHGSNDGAKGIGLILLILIGILPATYALNMSSSADDIHKLRATAISSQALFSKHAGGAKSADPTADLSAYIKSDGKLSNQTFAAMAATSAKIDATLAGKDSLEIFSSVEQRTALRSDIYLLGESLGKLKKNKQALADEDKATRYALYGAPQPWHHFLTHFFGHEEASFYGDLSAFTHHIPAWVKLAVAFSLGLGTMIGWKRIVVTVGEKIGKDHLTYAQGAAAELIAMSTIAVADGMGLPVSTTHVLSSGVAGTMAANKSGLQLGTLRNLLLAWVLTLPVCVILGAGTFGAGLYIVLHNLVTHTMVVAGVCLVIAAVLLFRRVASLRCEACGSRNIGRFCANCGAERPGIGQGSPEGEVVA
jgi:PiT family inorganic phosphate transporter